MAQKFIELTIVEVALTSDFAEVRELLGTMTQRELRDYEKLLTDILSEVEEAKEPEENPGGGEPFDGGFDMGDPFGDNPTSAEDHDNSERTPREED